MSQESILRRVVLLRLEKPTFLLSRMKGNLSCDFPRLLPARTECTANAQQTWANNASPSCLRKIPDMMSALEGGGGSWKSGRSKGGRLKLVVKISSNADKGEGVKKCH